MKEDDIREVVDLGKELEDLAVLVFSYEGAIQALMKQLVDEAAKQTRQQANMWRKAEKALKEKYPDKSTHDLSFNHAQQKFIIRETIDNNYRS